MQRTLFRLKATHLIPPAVALALVGAWNVSQLRSISAMEHDAADLKGKIAKVVASSDPQPSARAAKSPSAGRRQAVDWKQLSASLVAQENGGGMSGVRAGVSFQQQLDGMSKKEMIDALDEIEALDLSTEQREALEEMILAPLIREDPEYALNRFASRISDESGVMSWQLASALGAWAKNNLAGATEWFDRQIAAGTFDSKTLDGKSDARVNFESALMESLLASDASAAGRRLAEIPEDQRREVLQQLWFPDLGPQEQQAYTELVRQLVPADERQGSFAHIASQLVDNTGYGKVSEFLDGVRATPQERAAAAVQTAESRLQMLGVSGEVTRQEVDRMRDWLKLQAPGEVDSITGKSLAEAAQERGKFKYSEASQLVLQYQQSTGKDDVLVSFLESYSARSNLEEAKDLANRITDEKRRAEILLQLK